MKQTAKDRRDEARAGHRVNEQLDRTRKDRDDRKEADLRAGGRKANETLRREHDKKEADLREGGRKANETLRREREEGYSGALSSSRSGIRVGGGDKAGEEMEGVGAGMMPDRGSPGLGPYSGIGGATGSPAPRMGKIPSGHGPE